MRNISASVLYYSPVDLFCNCIIYLFQEREEKQKQRDDSMNAAKQIRSKKNKSFSNSSKRGQTSMKNRMEYLLGVIKENKALNSKC